MSAAASINVALTANSKIDAQFFEQCHAQYFLYQYKFTCHTSTPGFLHRPLVKNTKAYLQIKASTQESVDIPLQCS